MMKNIKYINFALLSLFALAGCDKNDESGQLSGDPVAVQFGTSDIATTRTTVSPEGNTQWLTNDKIGIFMIAKDAAAISGNIKEGADNVPYEADAGTNNVSSFKPVSGTPIYYPLSGTVDFVVYYPYRSSLTNYTYAVDVSIQTKPEDIDVLYSNNAKGYDKNSNTVSLQFNHTLSKLSFTLTSGEGLPDLIGAKVEISGVATTAAIELADGSITPSNSNQTVTANTADNGLTSSAIMIPQILSGTKLIVTLADNASRFEWTFDTSQIPKFEQGKKYGYAITIGKTGITVTTGDIDDWKDKDASATEGAGGVFYNVGNYYPDPNAVYSGGMLVSGTAALGVVFWVDPSDGRHGKALGLQENSSVKWANGYNITDATDMSNGRVNMRTIYNINPSNPFSGYPAFSWVHSLNSGSEDYSNPYATGVWYLPAKDELQYLLCAATGKSPATWDSDYPSFNSGGNQLDKTAFNKKLIAAGGTVLGSSYYWSSSEYNIGNAWLVYFLDGNTLYYYKPFVDYRTRCFLAF